MGVWGPPRDEGTQGDGGQEFPQGWGSQGNEGPRVVGVRTPQGWGGLVGV